jgi:hypothetical protein
MIFPTLSFLGFSRLTRIEGFSFDTKPRESAFFFYHRQGAAAATSLSF